MARPRGLGPLTAPSERASGEPAAEEPTAAERARVGLCADCRWMRRVATGRGSVFYLCRRAETDPAFPRYPRVPREACPGYERDIKVGG